MPTLYEIVYFRHNGKFHKRATLTYDGELRHAVAKIRGWRDCGAVESLPGISGEGWDGPILIQAYGSNTPHVLMPRK